MISIQLIAMITMLIDHIGYLFFPDQLSWRIIGRLAMPLYTYALVQGYFRTRNIDRYLQRIAIIAVLSQIPFMLALQIIKVNFVGTLFVCLLLIRLLDRWKDNMLLQGTALFAALILLEIIPFDYGAYAALLVLIYRYTSVQWMTLAHLALNLFFFIAKGMYIQIFSLPATAMLVYLPSFMDVMNRIRVPKWIWRSFYPLHFLLLAIIYYYVNKM